MQTAYLKIQLYICKYFKFNKLVNSSEFVNYFTMYKNRLLSNCI